MKSFKFQQFELQQSKEVFRVGTDAVILGALADIHDAKNVLEVGVGCGVISLMLAQRFPEANLEAVDINEAAVELAKINFSNSIFSSRLKVFQADFKKYNFESRYDVLITNPPFYEVNDSQKDVLARQRLELDYTDIVLKTQQVLNKNGKLIVIIPFLDAEIFVQVANDNNLNLLHRINIRGIDGGEMKRVILEFVLEYNDEATEEEFTIEKSPRQYTDEYLEVTKDFHIFKEK